MTGPPLFFVHGLWSTPAAFAGLRARLAAAGYASVAPALPYHDRPPDAPPAPELATLSVEDCIDFLVDEIARLPVKPVIAGHSLGGFLAQAVAARVGAPGLMLFAPAAAGAVALAPVRTLAGIVLGGGRWWDRPVRIDAAHARWGLFNAVPSAVAEAEIAALVWDSGRVLFELGLPFLARTQATRIDHARLTMPTLIVVGEHDRMAPPAVARATARRIAGRIDYHELPGAGHWLWHGAVEEAVAQLAIRWIEALPVTSVQ